MPARRRTRAVRSAVRSAQAAARAAADHATRQLPLHAPTTRLLAADRLAVSVVSPAGGTGSPADTEPLGPGACRTGGGDDLSLSITVATPGHSRTADATGPDLAGPPAARRQALDRLLAAATGTAAGHPSGSLAGLAALTWDEDRTEAGDVTVTLSAVPLHAPAPHPAPPFLTHLGPAQVQELLLTGDRALTVLLVEAVGRRHVARSLDAGYSTDVDAALQTVTAAAGAELRALAQDVHAAPVTVGPVRTEVRAWPCADGPGGPGPADPGTDVRITAKVTATLCPPPASPTSGESPSPVVTFLSPVRGPR